MSAIQTIEVQSSDVVVAEVAPRQFPNLLKGRQAGKNAALKAKRIANLKNAQLAKKERAAFRETKSEFSTQKHVTKLSSNYRLFDRCEKLFPGRNCERKNAAIVASAL